MRPFAFLTLLVMLFVSSVASAQDAPTDTFIFALIMTRHGVRSFTHTLPNYTWPDWSPVDPGFLSEHGYRLMTYMGEFYRNYFAERGLSMGCNTEGTYVYADRDQRTLETARALIEGACGHPDALPMYHLPNLAPNVNDPLFSGAQAFAPDKVDPEASRAAVIAALPVPPSALVSQHAGEFAALQTLLDRRCSGTCPRADSGDYTVVARRNMYEYSGPIVAGSDYAEDLFLESAQCEPDIDPQDIEQAMQLHVAEYDVNARNAYSPWVRAGNIFAHAIAMIDEKAGKHTIGIESPDLSRTKVAIFSGHDTQVGAFGGMLGVRWKTADGLAPDDTPPGGALVFELFRNKQGAYFVRVEFASQSMAQYRKDSELDGGAVMTTVGTYPLAHLETLAQKAVSMGFVQKTWVKASSAPVDLAPLHDPSWTKCDP